MNTIMRNNKGFTIVELLIVIVIIAILATISFLTFNGLSVRAEESKLQSDLRGAATQLGVDSVDQGSYLTYSSSGDGIKKSEGTIYQYTRTSDKEYCLTATSSKEGVKTYHIANNKNVTEGACAGHTYGIASPSNPAVAVGQKLNTFVANIKTHAQANGLSLADYSTSGYSDTAQSNILEANPGYVATWEHAEATWGAGVAAPDGSVYILHSHQPTHSFDATLYDIGSGQFSVTVGVGGDIISPISEGYDGSPIKFGREILEALIETVVANGSSGVDAATISGYVDGYFGEGVVLVSGGAGGPWVFSINQNANANTVPDSAKPCQYTMSAAGANHAKFDNYSC